MFTIQICFIWENIAVIQFVFWCLYWWLMLIHLVVAPVPWRKANKNVKGFSQGEDELIWTMKMKMKNLQNVYWYANKYLFDKAFCSACKWIASHGWRKWWWWWGHNFFAFAYLLHFLQMEMSLLVLAFLRWIGSIRCYRFLLDIEQAYFKLTF